MRNKTILITGGSGSIGQFIAKQLLNYPVKKIKIYSRDEYKQYKMRLSIQDDRMRFMIGDVKDKTRLDRVLENVDIVIHCAALKQIDTCEFDPLEAKKVNIDGAENIINACLDRKVEKVINISTDKVVNPTSLYGSTKLVAERLFTDANLYSWGKPIFSSIRCGNFIESKGAIFPLFYEMVKKGKDKLPLTDINMTRFLMRFNDGFELLMYALRRMRGGEIFVKSVKSFKPIDLIYAFGKNPCKINLRPYEKLHEEIIDKHEKVIIDKNYYIIEPEWTKRKVKTEINFNSFDNKFYKIDELRNLIKNYSEVN